MWIPLTTTCHDLVNVTCHDLVNVTCLFYVKWFDVRGSYLFNVNIDEIAPLSLTFFIQERK